MIRRHGNTYGSGDANTYGYEDGAYTDDQMVSSLGDNAQYAAEFYALDADAQVVCSELAPEFLGDAASLGDLDELCRRMRRPLRDGNERRRLLTLLDPDNAMRIQRVAFTTWLLDDLYQEQNKRNAELLVTPAQRTSHAPPPQPIWEEIVDATASSKYYYNSLTGETSWELPSKFVSFLFQYLVTLDETRTLKASLDAHGFPDLQDPSRDLDWDLLVDELCHIFQKFDDDKSDSLDPSEFQDLCVAIGFLLGSANSSDPSTSALQATMLEINASYSSTPDSASVSWDALQYFWICQAPFQRRSALSSPYDQWERIESLSVRSQAPRFRHAVTQSERWSHPHMELSVVELLTKLFPSTKLEWTQRIAMFYDLQLKSAKGEKTGKTGGGGGGGEDDSGGDPDAPSAQWTLSECRAVLSLLGHDCRRRAFVVAAVQAIRSRFSQDASATNMIQTMSGATTEETLDLATATRWLEHCVARVEMDGWEEIVDETNGVHQRYFYHEIRGETQWDPPQLETRLAAMMKRFGSGGDSSSSHDEHIQRIFRHYDTDESGSISFSEFTKLYVSLLGRKEAVSSDNEADTQHMQRVFATLDTSGDDAVSVEEFTVWFKTKLNLEQDESAHQARERTLQQRKQIAMDFLQRQHGFTMPSAAKTIQTQGQDDTSEVTEDPLEEATFESNLLPRLVAVLGKYPLQGITYRKALQELVRLSDQQIVLRDFLKWYAEFEQREQEKEELLAQKARALALLQQQEAEQQEKARKLKMLRKGQLLTKVIASDAPGVALQPAEIVWRRHVETLFRKFDKDGSGYLEAPELQELTKALGHTLTQPQITQMMAVMDTSGDARVSLEEFLTFWSAFQRRQRAATSSSSPGPTESAKSKSKTKKKKAGDGEESQRREGISMVSTASASMAVSTELAKDRALKLSMNDIKDALGDWKESLLDRKVFRHPGKNVLAHQQQQHEKELQRRQLYAAPFVPAGKRRYAHVDVTWIEPEIVRCVVDMIRSIVRQATPLPRQDAAMRIQKIVRGVVTRMRSFAMVQQRLLTCVDVETSLYYYVDSQKHGNVYVQRPLFPTIASTVSPFELRDCRDKVSKLRFTKRQNELLAKTRFYQQYAAGMRPASAMVDAVQYWKVDRRLYVPATFAVYTILDSVRVRLLGSLWQALRGKSFVLAQLVAQHHWRQLTLRSTSDAAAPLPLHYVVQRHHDVPFHVIRAIYKGFPEAVCEQDAYGRTPLHLAFRERAGRGIVELLVSQRCQQLPPGGLTGTSSSVWRIQSATGDTPLHVALRAGVSLELLRWICSHRSFAVASAGDQALCTIRNSHGAAVFHLVVGALFDASSSVAAAYWRSVVLVLLRTWPRDQLCGSADTHGDLPLHLAIQRYANVTNQRTQCQQDRSTMENTEHDVHWRWLVELLMDSYPQALLVRRKRDSLGAIHLLMRAHCIPDPLVVDCLRATLAIYTARPHTETAFQSCSFPDNEELLVLRETTTTLLHYALVHRSTATELLDQLLQWMPRACHVRMLPRDELPLHVACRHNPSPAILRRLCELNGVACQTRNKNHELPLHLATTSAHAAEDAARVLLHYCPFVWNDPRERHGLTSLVMASNARRPNASVIRALLDHTPAQPLTAATTTTMHHVTPMYAISMRKCGKEIVESGILREFQAKFETIEHEEAYFTALAKDTHRRQHRCPTASWSFPQILHLMEMNPVDEAILQRSLLAMNEKLTQMIKANGALSINQNDISDEGINPARVMLNVVVETVTLNSEWLVVRRVHQTMYELPWNARIQLLGQTVLHKLLPTAYAKATYKARIDPYFDLP